MTDLGVTMHEAMPPENTCQYHEENPIGPTGLDHHCNSVRLLKDHIEQSRCMASHHKQHFIEK
jgi:hypothetical protein